MKKVRRILLLANFVSFFGFSLFSPLYAIYAQKVTGDIFTIASSYGIYAIVMGLSLLFFGRVTNGAKNKRKIVVIGYFLLSGGAFSFLFVHSVTQLIIVQIINATGSGMVTPAWQALYAKNEDKGKEIKEWSFYDGGNMILVGIASFIGGYLVNRYGFQLLFVVVGTIQLMGALLSLRLLKK